MFCFASRTQALLDAIFKGKLLLQEPCATVLRFPIILLLFEASDWSSMFRVLGLAGDPGATIFHDVSALG